MTWNCQGCGSHRFLRSFKEYTQDHKPHMLALLETRISGRKADSAINRTRFARSYRVETAGPKKNKRKALWKDLNEGHNNISVPWVLAGGFNAILSNTEKRGGSTRTNGCKHFQEFIDKNHLRDLGFKGPRFTWNRGMIYERLDRMVANVKWTELAPKASVIHLPRLKSYHLPILLQPSNRLLSQTVKPFRFLASWTTHLDFNQFVRGGWHSEGNIINSLSNSTNDQGFKS
ncbi:uncharacterized protein LOC120156237 [Hibiscus syriacus]|uniref:uncharacterized protein LOC120156237 n=1 Tax=Hibiscus syriacus TaxID=106335 RepID=UPI0019236A99|nr:uncharacterized protein LOC120156237 [Hibiscus syriacus]